MLDDNLPSLNRHGISSIEAFTGVHYELAIHTLGSANNAH